MASLRKTHASPHPCVSDLMGALVAYDKPIVSAITHRHIRNDRIYGNVVAIDTTNPVAEATVQYQDGSLTRHDYICASWLLDKVVA